MTNEQMCDFIRQGGSDDLKPVLWERTEKLFYQLAQRRYNAYREIAARTGTEFSDCRQVCYFAFNDALQDYIPIRFVKEVVSNFAIVSKYIKRLTHQISASAF